MILSTLSSSSIFAFDYHSWLFKKDVVEFISPSSYTISGDVFREPNYCNNNITGALENTVISFDPGGGLGFDVLTDVNGHYSITYNSPTPQFNYTLCPSKNGNPAEGLTALDINKVRSFILGQSCLTEAWEYFAADAILNGHITAQDINEITQTILGTGGRSQPWLIFDNATWNNLVSNLDIDCNNYYLPSYNTNSCVEGLNSATVNFTGIRVGDVYASAVSCDAIKSNDLFIRTNELEHLPIYINESYKYLEFILDPSKLNLSVLINDLYVDHNLFKVVSVEPMKKINDNIEFNYLYDISKNSLKIIQIKDLKDISDLPIIKIKLEKIENTTKINIEQILHKNELFCNASTLNGASKLIKYNLVNSNTKESLDYLLNGNNLTIINDMGENEQKIVVYNLEGKLLYESFLKEGYQKIDNLESGILIIYISSKNNTKSFKVFIN